MKQFLIILRGAPGSGKSTIAKRFRDYKKKIVWLKVDNFKDFFSEDGQEGLVHANEAALVTLEYLLDHQFSVVMENIFQDIRYITEAVELATKKGIRVLVFQLSCPLEVLQERDRTRPGIKEGCRKPLGDAVISNLSTIVQDTPIPNSILLDTHALSIEKCVEKINSLI